MTTLVRTPSFLRRFAAALASGAAVAVIAYLVSMLAYFVGGNALAELHNFFIWSTLFVFFFSIVFALIGAYSHWYTALAGGVIVAAAGSVIGSSLVAVRAGHVLDGDVARASVGTLAGPNLVFSIAVIVATVSAGATVWRLVLGREAALSSRQIALVRPPASTLADGELTHLERVPVNVELANTQWDAYVSALADNGWDVRELPLADQFPDSVFIEDTVVMFGKTAVVTSPGIETRKGETEASEKAARRLGQKVEHIVLPGTLDGGDVLKVGKTVYVGRGGRTNAEGIRQLRLIVARLGYKVVAVPVTMALHLKSSVTALPDGTIIGYPPVVDNAAMFDRFLAVPEIGGLAVMVLAPDTVLMAASAPKSAAMIADLGYRVITVDISEFEKLEGCVTCLSVRVR